MKKKIYAIFLLFWSSSLMADQEICELDDPVLFRISEKIREIDDLAHEYGREKGHGCPVRGVCPESYSLKNDKIQRVVLCVRLYGDETMLHRTIVEKQCDLVRLWERYSDGQIAQELVLACYGPYGTNAEKDMVAVVTKKGELVYCVTGNWMAFQDELISRELDRTKHRRFFLFGIPVVGFLALAYLGVRRKKGRRGKEN